MLSELEMGLAREAILKNPKEKEACFNFHYETGAWLGYKKSDAKARFDEALLGKFGPELFLDSYITSGLCSPKELVYGMEIKRDLKAAAITAVVGLATLVASYYVDDASARHAVRAIGMGGSIGGLIGTVVNSIRYIFVID